MSEMNARTRLEKGEKAILTELLNLYKSSPCLWDQKHEQYGDREARNQAYQVLLETYKLIQSDATICDVKKKIEYLRCAYRREHKRVLEAHSQGEAHRPTLWYYDLLKFLNDYHPEIKPVKTEYCQETHEIIDSDADEDGSPANKRACNGSNNVIYVSEQLNNIDGLEDPDSYQDHEQSLSFIVSNESESFGRTIGFQLKELNHMQRVFAEKLISDVIFQARLCNLSAETSLNLGPG
ncbi:hypothetical protein MSG28_003545 [Choristoneura fumiferana]|uniref:Uncharacterized protein n=1 Tax=Choristoneura fumiferana TaxID=7141 RepID=A0ACC0KFX8_CHOFU|nr:hypothetical protein MSG28_003545 [Choristoneura fumiferana]